jgi:translin
VHRDDASGAAALVDEAASALAEAQVALAPFAWLAAAGPLHDAEKEYAEARLTAALIAGTGLPTYDQLSVRVSAWLGGLCEAASELRRYALDRLRDGDLARGDELLATMGAVYDLLVSMDYPDAVTGGLRRSVDALRAVLERTRGDLATASVQARLQAAIESRLPPVE